jgi:hypothetical protein
MLVTEQKPCRRLMGMHLVGRARARAKHEAFLSNGEVRPIEPPLRRTEGKPKSPST